jgi:hypothetical protein
MIQILIQLLLSCRQKDVLGSRVDLPKNLIADPSCKVSNDKGFGGTCPLASLTRRVTRWEYSQLGLGCDSEMVLFSCQVPGVLLYLTSRGGKLKEKGLATPARRTPRHAEPGPAGGGARARVARP